MLVVIAIVAGLVGLTCLHQQPKQGRNSYNVHITWPAGGNHMNYFDLAFTYTLGNEGGLSNDKGDPGGLTKYGISHKAYPSLDIRNLSLEGAKEIYKRDYWLTSLLDKVTDKTVAIKLFDYGVNGGQGSMERLALVALNSCQYKEGKVYTKWDINAINAINKVSSTMFVDAFIRLIIHHYDTLITKNPNLAQFRNNWISRAHKLP